MLKKILKEIDTRPELLFRGRANVSKISDLTGIRETSLRSYFRGGKGLGYDNLQVLCKYLGLELVKTIKLSKAEKDIMSISIKTK